MQVEDLNLSGSPSVRLLGKGRKERSIPLWSSTASQLRQWLRTRPHTPTSPLFPNRSGSKLSRTNVTERLHLAVRTASANHRELAKRKVTPHIFRHSLAMHLLQAGVDVAVIALWLGHESPSTTHMYVEADLAMKERSLRSLGAPNVKAARFRPRSVVHWSMLFIIALPVTVLGDWLTDGALQSHLSLAVETRTRGSQFSWLRVKYVLALYILFAICAVAIFYWLQSPSV